MHTLQSSAYAIVPNRSQITVVLCAGLRVAFPCHHRADKTPACDPYHITHHLMQVDMYLVQRFLHVLYA